MEYKSPKVLANVGFVVGMNFNCALTGTFSDQINYSIAGNAFDDSVSAVSSPLSEVDYSVLKNTIDDLNSGICQMNYKLYKTSTLEEPSGLFSAVSSQVWESELAGREIDNQKTIDNCLG